MNYISDQKGILRRYKREREEWSGHLSNSGSFILEILKEHDFKKVVVLGSGWLLDFPLENILPFVEKISLVDVYFPPGVVKNVKRFDNIEIIQTDITGGHIKSIYEQVKASKKKYSFPLEMQVPGIIPEKGKLIVSLNLLNQLDILLVDYIRKYAICKEEDVVKFRKLIQESHIHMLNEHPYILITDYKEILINTQGKVLEERELIFAKIPAGDVSREWEWEFDTHHLYHDHANTRMKVMAMFSKGLK